MNNKVKTVLGLLAFIILIAGAYLAYNNLGDKYKPSNELRLQNSDSKNTQLAQSTQSLGDSQSTPTEQPEKMKAPDFTVIDSEGKAVKLSDLFGKPIVLNFWASWCPPCKSEMPYFNEVYQDVKDDVVFMMVDLVDGKRETVDKGKEYIKEQGFIFPVYFDTEQEAAYTYGISSIPTTLFIDKDGYIVTGSQGAMDEETLLKGIGYITRQ